MVVVMTMMGRETMRMLMTMIMMVVLVAGMVVVRGDGVGVGVVGGAARTLVWDWKIVSVRPVMRRRGSKRTASRTGAPCPPALPRPPEAHLDGPWANP